MADFRERRQLFAARQGRFVSVIGPCVIAAAAIIALGAGMQVRHASFPLGVALVLVAVAAALMIVDRDRPAAKLSLFALLCACIFVVLVLL